MSISVLLVEDDMIVQQVHKAMLLKLGCEVHIANSGEQAFEMAKNNLAFRLVFVDIGLPDISGFDVIKRLHAYYQDNAIATTLVAVTGYCGDEEREACFNAGVMDVLNKPVVLATLREVINKYI